MEEIIRILLKWSKSILLVVSIAIIGSILIALLLTEYFTSQVTFITANPYLMDRASIYSIAPGDNPVYLFGGGNDIDRIIMLSQSRELENYLIQKYHLFNHYEIDSTDRQADYWIRLELKEHFKILKTPLGMLEASVIDKNPQFAATMANDVVIKLDSLNKLIVGEKKKDILKLYQSDVKNQETKLTFLKDSLQNLINTNPKDTISANIVQGIVKKALDEYTNLKILHSQQLATMEQKFSSLYIVENAVPAVKRTSPVRWIIVATTTLVTLIAMCFIVVFIEKFNEWKAYFKTK